MCSAELPVVGIMVTQAKRATTATATTTTNTITTTTAAPPPPPVSLAATAATATTTTSTTTTTTTTRLGLAWLPPAKLSRVAPKAKPDPGTTETSFGV